MRGSVAECLVWAEKWLARCGIRSARLDAGVLLAFVLGVERTDLAVHPERQLDAPHYQQFERLIRRRSQFEPVAYLTGEKEFWSLPFFVDQRVLIPRPDTEILVESVQKVFQNRSVELYVDLGCGSGCIACALGALFPKSRGIAIDRDERALRVALKNIQALGMDDRIEVRHADGLGSLHDHCADIICANLPYIPSADCRRLQPDIRLYEPVSALDGGEDGLEIIRRVVLELPHTLKPDGYAFFEIGDGQASMVIEMFRSVGFARIDVEEDLSGTKRVIMACGEKIHKEP